MPDNRAALFEHRPADLEVILPGPDQSFRWYEHDYPYDLARWNHHPEYEIHLIRHGSGKLLAGDYIGPFTAGHVALIGPGLPHDWMGDVAPGELIAGRDVVLQFDGAALLNLRGSLPELSELKTLFELAQRGIEFTGATARDAALLLESIGEAQGLHRLIQFLDLLGTLARAPKRDIRVLASAYYSPSLDARSSERINQAFDYLINELTSDLRLSVIAERVGMSEAGFSRFFKRITGHGFIDLMRKLRIQRACRLLVQTKLSVAEICFEVGYENVSNFNRHFRHEMDQTPSDYRRTTAVTLFNRDGVHQSLPVARVL
jgi:AraC-like DNA-binding protein